MTTRLTITERILKLIPIAESLHDIARQREYAANFPGIDPVKEDAEHPITGKYLATFIIEVVNEAIASGALNDLINTSDPIAVSMMIGLVWEVMN